MIRARYVVVLGLVATLGCSKKSVANPDDYVEIAKSFEDAGSANGTRPTPVKPAESGLPGVDLSKLSATARKRFDALAETLASPCGKAHSLRHSVTSDPDCKRAPFAARYVARLLGEGFDEAEVRPFYEGRYRQDPPRTFALEGAAHAGPVDAKVVMVEFFDYGCPHCAEFAPLVNQVLDRYPSDVVVYFKMFPLGNNPDSVPAAQAALAAGRQGKFEEMHHLLLEDQQKHGRQELLEHARGLGLDMPRFEKDFADPAIAKRILADRKEGEDAGVMGTPFLFIGGRECAELSMVEISDWVDEALAVNR